jgi:poly(3-hydroxybutyrate) depolymerase
MAGVSAVMRCLVAACTAAIALVACDRDGGVNPPTEPAQPIQGPAAAAPPAKPPPGAETMLSGAGPVSFVGRWAAEADWCFNPRGDRVPIEITTTELRGYENRCEIQRITEISTGYEGLRMIATKQTLVLTWLDRGDQAVRLIRCTTLAD